MAAVTTSLALLAVALAAIAPGAALAEESPPVSVTVRLDRPGAAFLPERAFGAGLDGHALGDTAHIYTPRNIRAMGSVGLRSMTYRLRTELAVEAWHWNPRGRWSDPAQRRGYWTSAPRGPRYGVSYGYRLPRRGDTVDQANDDGYSRLDDGRWGTFWKSDPYLDPHYAGRAASALPQWLLIDLGRPGALDALRLDWAAPYAKRFTVQYWTGTNALLYPERHPGKWRPFPRHAFRGHPGRQCVRLARTPVSARFVRVLLRRSSHAALAGSRDVRDRLGFAVREVFLGRIVAGGFVDLVHHGRSNTRQSVTYVSSTDPWHRARDLDPGVEQPSFDRVFRSGLAGRLPALVPVALLYGTPQDAVNELRFLRGRHYPLRGVELGEEPDGQLASPQHYAALYLEFARALRGVAPRLPLGGPGFQTSLPDWVAWPDRAGNRSWVQQFLAVLRGHRRLGDLGFFSFEWYPFDDVCAPSAPKLRLAPEILARLMGRLLRDGLPPRIPKLITEYGYSAFAGEPEVDRAGGIFDAEVAAKALALGIRTSYLYGLEPDELIREASQCDTWGNLILFQSDADHHIRHTMASYYAMRLVTHAWAGRRPDRSYPAVVDDPAAGERGLVTAYALGRTDGSVALLLFNKDRLQGRTVSVRLQGARGAEPASGPADLYQLSRHQYKWHPRRDRGYPRPDGPAAHAQVIGDGGLSVGLPPSSVSVLVLEGRRIP